MSRIDISVTKKKSGKLITNQGFCRSSHLSEFCAESQDSEVRNFADIIFLGKDITEDNINDFLRILEYVMSYLLGINENERTNFFPLYKEEYFIQFINDLKNSLEFLRTLGEEKKLCDIEVEIL